MARRPEPAPRPRLNRSRRVRGRRRGCGRILSDAPAEPAAARTKGGDDDGARLIALNMALNGTPREETDRYLAENFKLTDRRGLLDEVYSSVQG